jgi:hypothetical protein
VPQGNMNTYIIIQHPKRLLQHQFNMESSNNLVKALVATGYKYSNYSTCCKTSFALVQLDGATGWLHLVSKYPAACIVQWSTQYSGDHKKNTWTNERHPGT